jgi:hypothetical protein
MILLIGVIPVTINSIGLREGAFVYLFSQLGVPGAEALALALLARIGLLLPGIVGGILFGLGTRRARASLHSRGNAQPVEEPADSPSAEIPR